MSSPSRRRTPRTGDGASSMHRAEPSKSRREGFRRSQRPWPRALNNFSGAGTAIVQPRPTRLGTAADDRAHQDRHAGQNPGFRLAGLRSLASRLCRGRVLSSAVGGARTCASGAHAGSGGVSATKVRPVSGVVRHARPAARGAGALRAPTDSGPRRTTGSAPILSGMRPIQRARGRTRARGHATIPSRLPLRSRSDAPGTIQSPRALVVNAPALAWGERGACWVERRLNAARGSVGFLGRGGITCNWAYPGSNPLSGAQSSAP